MMDAFLRQFVTCWRKFDVSSDARILIAVSGGVDSNALLGTIGALKSMEKFPNSCRIAHFDHRIRTNTEREKNLVGSLADRFGIPVVFGEADERPPSSNVEEWARRQRYGFLIEQAKEIGQDLVLTAHHKEDRVETFFLNLLRGAGAKGLSSMRERLVIADGVTLLRPFAQWAEKSDLISFCKRYEIEFAEDETNSSCEFKRNEVRQTMLPVLREIDGGFVNRVIRSMDLLEQVDRNIEFLFSENKELLALAQGKQLELASLNKYPRNIRGLVVKEWIKNCTGKGVAGLYSRVEAIVSLIESRKSGKTVELGDGLIVRKAHGRLRLEKNGS